MTNIMAKTTKNVITFCAGVISESELNATSIGRRKTAPPTKDTIADVKMVPK